MKGYRARARQWSRSAWAMALLFGSLPVASRVLFGEWAFEGAAGIAFVCLALGTYLHVVGRRYAALPDPATRLEESLEAARSGHVAEAVELLSREIRLSPGLWQAYQFRGELRLLLPEGARAALADFEQAIRLAPDEPHLRTLRDQAAALLQG